MATTRGQVLGEARSFEIKSRLAVVLPGKFGVGHGASAFECPLQQTREFFGFTAYAFLEGA